MRKNIANVIAAFKARRAHREATCHTDGATIWSYAMPIAWRNPDDGATIITTERSSVTTNGQINACKKELL